MIVKTVAENNDRIDALALIEAMFKSFGEKRLTLKAMSLRCRRPGVNRRGTPRRRVAAAVEKRRHPQMQLAAAAPGLIHQLALHQVETLPHGAEAGQRPADHDFHTLAAGVCEQPPGARFEIVAHHPAPSDSPNRHRTNHHNTRAICS